MESPRGFNDATLGAFNDLIRRVDLIILLGKAFDFTLKFGEAPIDPACRFISIDPEGALVERAAHETSARFAFGCVADTHPAGDTLIRRAGGRAIGSTAWLAEARAAFIEPPQHLADAEIADARKAARHRGVPSAEALRASKTPTPC